MRLAQGDSTSADQEKASVYEAFRNGTLDEARATIELLRIDLLGARTPPEPEQEAQPVVEALGRPAKQDRL